MTYEQTHDLYEDDTNNLLPRKLRVDQREIPCPRLCGASFSPGCNKLAVFFNTQPRILTIGAMKQQLRIQEKFGLHVPLDPSREAKLFRFPHVPRTFEEMQLLREVLARKAWTTKHIPLKPGHDQYETSCPNSPDWTTSGKLTTGVAGLINKQRFRDKISNKFGLVSQASPLLDADAMPSIDSPLHQLDAQNRARFSSIESGSSGPNIIRVIRQPKAEDAEIDYSSESSVASSEFSFDSQLSDFSDPCARAIQLDHQESMQHQSNDSGANDHTNKARVCLEQITSGRIQLLPSTSITKLVQRMSSQSSNSTSMYDGGVPIYSGAQLMGAASTQFSRTAADDETYCFERGSNDSTSSTKSSTSHQPEIADDQESTLNSVVESSVIRDRLEQLSNATDTSPLWKQDVGNDSFHTLLHSHNNHKPPSSSARRILVLRGVAVLFDAENLSDLLQEVDVGKFNAYFALILHGSRQFSPYMIGDVSSQQPTASTEIFSSPTPRTVPVTISQESYKSLPKTVRATFSSIPPNKLVSILASSMHQIIQSPICHLCEGSVARAISLNCAPKTHPGLRRASSVPSSKMSANMLTQQTSAFEVSRTIDGTSSTDVVSLSPGGTQLHVNLTHLPLWCLQRARDVALALQKLSRTGTSASNDLQHELRSPLNCPSLDWWSDIWGLVSISSGLPSPAAQTETLMHNSRAKRCFEGEPTVRQLSAASYGDYNARSTRSNLLLLLHKPRQTSTSQLYPQHTRILPRTGYRLHKWSSHEVLRDITCMLAPGGYGATGCNRTAPMIRSHLSSNYQISHTLKSTLSTDVLAFMSRFQDMRRILPKQSSAVNHSAIGREMRSFSDAEQGFLQFHVATFGVLLNEARGAWASQQEALPYMDFWCGSSVETEASNNAEAIAFESLIDTLIRESRSNSQLSSCLQRSSSASIPHAGAKVDESSNFESQSDSFTSNNLQSAFHHWCALRGSYTYADSFVADLPPQELWQYHPLGLPLIKRIFTQLAERGSHQSAAMIAAGLLSANHSQMMEKLMQNHLQAASANDAPAQTVPNSNKQKLFTAKTPQAPFGAMFGSPESTSVKKSILQQSQPFVDDRKQNHCPSRVGQPVVYSLYYLGDDSQSLNEDISDSEHVPSQIVSERYKVLAEYALHNKNVDADQSDHNLQFPAQILAIAAHRFTDVALMDATGHVDEQRVFDDEGTVELDDVSEYQSIVQPVDKIGQRIPRVSPKKIGRYSKAHAIRLKHALSSAKRRHSIHRIRGRNDRRSGVMTATNRSRKSHLTAQQQLEHMYCELFPAKDASTFARQEAQRLQRLALVHQDLGHQLEIEGGRSITFGPNMSLNQSSHSTENNLPIDYSQSWSTQRDFAYTVGMTDLCTSSTDMLRRDSSQVVNATTTSSTLDGALIDTDWSGRHAGFQFSHSTTPVVAVTSTGSVSFPPRIISDPFTTTHAAYKAVDKNEPPTLAGTSDNDAPFMQTNGTSKNIGQNSLYDQGDKSLGTAGLQPLHDSPDAKQHSHDLNTTVNHHELLPASHNVAKPNEAIPSLAPPTMTRGISDGIPIGKSRTNRSQRRRHPSDMHESSNDTHAIQTQYTGLSQSWGHSMDSANLIYQNSWNSTDPSHLVVQTKGTWFKDHASKYTPTVYVTQHQHTVYAQHSASIESSPAPVEQPFPELGDEDSLRQSSMVDSEIPTPSTRNSTFERIPLKSRHLDTNLSNSSRPRSVAFADFSQTNHSAASASAASMDTKVVRPDAPDRNLDSEGVLYTKESTHTVARFMRKQLHMDDVANMVAQATLCCSVGVSDTLIIHDFDYTPAEIATHMRFGTVNTKPSPFGRRAVKTATGNSRMSRIVQAASSEASWGTAASIANEITSGPSSVIDWLMIRVTWNPSLVNAAQQTFLQPMTPLATAESSKPLEPICTARQVLSLNNQVLMNSLEGPSAWLLDAGTISLARNLCLEYAQKLSDVQLNASADAFRKLVETHEIISAISASVARGDISTVNLFGSSEASLEVATDSVSVPAWNSDSGPPPVVSVDANNTSRCDVVSNVRATTSTVATSMAPMTSTSSTVLHTTIATTTETVMSNQTSNNTTVTQTTMSALMTREAMLCTAPAARGTYLPILDQTHTEKPQKIKTQFQTTLDQISHTKVQISRTSMDMPMHTHLRRNPSGWRTISFPENHGSDSTRVMRRIKRL